MVWEAIERQISDSIHHYSFRESESSSVLTFDNAIELWKSNSEAGRANRDLLTSTLVGCPFKAFRWETPVVDSDRLDRRFEFVLLNSPGLARNQNRKPFRIQLERAKGKHSVTFPNIGNNAMLVAPVPASGQTDHCHLASFLRTADFAQTDALWQAVGELMGERVSSKPVWLNTAGGGVAWLHVRLDDRPKYYGYEPFKAM